MTEASDASGATKAGPTEKSKHSIPRPLLIVMAVSFVVAVFMVFVGFGMQGSVANPGDPYHYKEIAQHFAEHGFDQLTRRAAMLYPHVLWLVYELGAGDLVIQLLHILFHFGTCSLVFLIARRVFNERTALLAGLATALHPMLLRYVGDFHTETMLVFMTTLTVWCAVRFHFKATIPNAILLGVVGTLGAITKGVVLPVLVTYAVVWFVFALRRKQAFPKLGPVVMIGIASVLTVAPWTYRNYEVSGGRFVLLTPGTPDAFLRGYIFTRVEYATLQLPPYVYAENESNNLFKQIAKDAGTTWELDEVADDDNNKRYMMQYMKDHPFLTVRKFIVGLFTYWYQMTSLANSLIPGTLALGGWILAFVGFKRARAEKHPFWLVLLPVVTMNVFVAMLIPLGRYSVPVLPCLMMLAAFGVDTLFARWQARKASAAS